MNTLETLEKLTSEIKVVSQSYIQKPSKINNQSSDCSGTKNLKYTSILKDKSLVLLSSDKGNSLVFLDSVRYYSFGHAFFSSERFCRVLHENEKNDNNLNTVLASLQKDGLMPSGFRAPVA